MDGIKIEVTGNVARCTAKPSKITAGTVGLPVEFTFDAEHWDGLSKTAVFLAGHECKIADGLDSEAIVPWELLEKPGAWLHIGVYGSNEDGTIVIPTIFASVGAIVPGANPGGDPSTDPTLPVWQGVIADIGDTDKLETDQKNNLVDAVNEVYNLAKAGGVKTDETLSIKGSPADAAAVGNALANQPGQKTAKGGEIFNFYTDPVYTGDNPPKEYPGNTAAKGSHAEGFATHADGEYSHSEGWNTTASGGIAHAEGKQTVASGYAAHAQGISAKASGRGSHAEGNNTSASGQYSHSEGDNTTASGDFSHSEGQQTKATAMYSHAEGFKAEATGSIAHAQGRETLAEGYASHAQNHTTKATGYASTAAGRGTIAAGKDEFVLGKFNEITSNNDHALVVGGGLSDTDRKNIYTLDWDGNGWFAGDVYVYGANQTAGLRLARANEIPKKLPNPNALFINGKTYDGSRAVSVNIEETDPTVPDWAKASTKPSYTAAEVGAAPSGFGLGAMAINGTAATNLDSLLNNGWYYVPDALSPVGQAGVLRTDSYQNSAMVHQTFYAGSGSMQGYILRRYSKVGSWQPWEWFSPPMEDGVEYRTTERNGGLPVYVKTFAFQPNVTTTFGTGEYDHGITGFKYLCRVEARTESNVLPLITNERTVCISGVTREKVKISATKQDFTDYVSVTLWYTKN